MARLQYQEPVIRHIIAKYEGKCNRCGGTIQKGEEIVWKNGRWFNSKFHLVCPEQKKGE